VLEAVRHARLTEEQRDDLAVAVAEALSNAAVHGNRLQPRRRVRVRVEVTPDGGAAVEVSDSGAGFDSAAAPDPTDPARVLIPGGRGVFLMRRLVDRLEYNEAGNSVRMTIYGPRSRR
jgi:serine/threonine-protein kinase RsbW